MATQKLILPINKMSVTAGFKNANYYKKFGYKHYGIDVTSVGSDRTIWGCGVGRILETGFDNVLGNVVVIRYDNCHIKNGTTKNLIQRLYHLNRIDVSKGQSITKDTRIGLYGSTGQHVTGTHLHIEFDTDVNYPTYSPTLGTSSNIIKAGTDSVLNPADVMHIKSTAPDNQSVAGTSNSDCWASSDLSFPMYNGTGETGGTYYPTPNYNGTSLVEALKSIGVDSSFDNREKIANVNGISNYTGTQEQNETLLALLMKGQLKRPGSSGGSGGGETGGTYYPTPNYNGTSLVEALKSIGVDSSFDNREKIANVNGISNYTGTQEQNETLLALLMKGQLKRPGSSGGSGGGETESGSTDLGQVSGLSIRKNLVSSNKYDIKATYPMTPTFITVHNTANDASAENEISYMISNDNQVSFHYAVDDKEAVQGLPLNRNGWHSGDGADGAGNRKSIGVEICYSKSGGERFEKAEKNAAKLVAALMRHFNIPLSNVRTHQSWSGKYCPHRTLDLGWDRFVKMIEKEFESFVPNKELFKFVSENGLLKGCNVTFAEFNKRTHIATLSQSPLVKIEGEVGLTETLKGPYDTINLSRSPESFTTELLDMLGGHGSIAFDINREDLLVTISKVSLEENYDKNIKMYKEISGGYIYITLESSTEFTYNDITTTIYQRIIITIEPKNNNQYTVAVPMGIKNPFLLPELPKINFAPVLGFATIAALAYFAGAPGIFATIVIVPLLIKDDEA